MEIPASRSGNVQKRPGSSSRFQGNYGMVKMEVKSSRGGSLGSPTGTFSPWEMVHHELMNLDPTPASVFLYPRWGPPVPLRATSMRAEVLEASRGQQGALQQNQGSRCGPALL